MKWLGIAFFLLFLLFVPVISVSAQEEQKEMLEISVISELTPTPVSYTLPYPGILPDNPLYPMKTFRDRIIGFFISDSLKKAEFNLLQANKRLQAGILLVENDKSKLELAESTISKGQNYFEKAIEKAKEADEKGMEAGSMLHEMVKAGRKHNEVLVELQSSLPREDKEKLEPLIIRTNSLVKTVDLIISQR